MLRAITFGVLLALLLFAMGFVVGSSPHPVGSTPDYYEPYRALRDWFAKDAAGFFTFWLFLIGAGQVVLFYVQLRLIRASLDEAKTAADAAASAATSASRQAHVAEQTLAKIERPYLFIFNVSALRIEEDYDHDAGETYNLLRITYSVANYGKIPAIIEHAAIGMSVSTEPLDPLYVDFNHPFAVSSILTAGQLCPDNKESFSWTGEVSRDEMSGEYPELGDHNLWFRAELKYRGPFSNGHETSACWRYDPRTGRFFESLGVEKYNYQT
jgi:hypothetical protein